MNSIVIDLQENALDSSVKTSDLLQKAFVVARKLKLSEFLVWAESERTGYRGCKEKIPEYRMVEGRIRGWNPYNKTWIPITFDNVAIGNALSKTVCCKSIAELERLIENGSSGSYFHIPYSDNMQRQLTQPDDTVTEVSLHVGQSVVIRVIDSVRNIILNWALKLEEDGILGEGLSFSEKEKNRAISTPQNVNNFHGPVNAPQIQQGNQTAIQVSLVIDADLKTIIEFINKLKKNVEQLDLCSASKAELSAEIATVEAQLKSPKPKTVIVKESLKTIRTVLETATGAAAGQMLIELSGMLTT